MRGRRVMVCGASSGIGKELALAYSSMGAHVALVARRESLLREVGDEARRDGAASVTVVPADLGTQAGVEAAMLTTLAAPAFNGSLDVLVLNHAVQRWGWLLPDRGPVPRATLGTPGPSWPFDFVDTALAVNFGSFVKLTVLAMPALRRGTAEAAIQKDGSPRSRVIAVSSAAGKMPVIKQSIYAGAKHALHGFFDSVRLEVEHKAFPVTFTTVVLGLVRTEAVQLTSEDIHLPMADPADAARAIISAGEAGREELYWPPSQFLQVLATLRTFPGIRYGLDRLTLFMSKGPHHK